MEEKGINPLQFERRLFSFLFFDGGLTKIMIRQRQRQRLKICTEFDKGHKFINKCSILFTFAREGKIAKCTNGCGDNFCLNPMEFKQGEGKIIREDTIAIREDAIVIKEDTIIIRP